MVSENKQILKYCPNFYKIINFNPLEEDVLSEKIIKIYQEYIFKINLANQNDIEEIKNLDAAVFKYINDFSFRKEVQRQIVNIKVKNTCSDILKFFIEAIINIFRNYEDFTTRVIYVSRWI